MNYKDIALTVCRQRWIPGNKTSMAETINSLNYAARVDKI